MKNYTLKITSFSLLLIFAFVLAPKTFAQANNAPSFSGTGNDMQELRKMKEEKVQNRMDQVEEKRLMLQEEKEDRLANRCDKAYEKINTRIENFEENKENHKAKYEDFIARVEEKLAMLKEKGYDVSQLEEDLETLKGMVDEYVTLYVAFISELEGSLEYDCGNSEGAFKKAVSAAHSKLQEARAKRREIREFYRTTIREHLQDLRNQTVVDSSETGE